MWIREKLALTYDDVTLAPKLSDIPHRNEENIKISSYLGPVRMNLPVISSPMDTVTEGTMAIAMRQHGGLGVIHRYNSPNEQAAIVSECNAEAAAVGMTGDFLERAQILVEAGVRILCIDTAHAHHANMKNALETLRKEFGDDVHLMAGNVATGQGAYDLANWGANSIRVGIGGGSICSTRLQTGFGVPNLTAIMECAAELDETHKIIADGGIRTSGDMIKAFAAGADFVMLGSMLAGTSQAPGEVIAGIDGPLKIYRGMASRDAQHGWRGTSSSPEGISVTIPFKGDVGEILTDLPGYIRSGFSYNGARNIEELRDNAEFVIQTNAGIGEGKTHIDSIR